MTKLEKILSALVAAVLVLGFVIYQNKPSPSFGGVYEYGNVFTQTSTSSQVTISSEIRLLATSSLRRMVTISPVPTCTQGIFVSLANDAPATTANGIFVNASSTFLIDSIRLYTGAIHAIPNGGTCSINTVAAQ